jgi:hypothetical protein
MFAGAGLEVPLKKGREFAADSLRSTGMPANPVEIVFPGALKCIRTTPHHLSATWPPPLRHIEGGLKFFGLK